LDDAKKEEEKVDQESKDKLKEVDNTI